MVAGRPARELSERRGPPAASMGREDRALGTERGVGEMLRNSWLKIVKERSTNQGNRVVWVFNTVKEGGHRHI